MTNTFPPYDNFYEDSFLDPSETPDRGRAFTTENMKELLDLITPSVESAAPTITSGPREPTIVPKFNILKGNNVYLLELAVPGFLESELSVIVDNNVLTVSGKPAFRSLNRPDVDIFRGIPEGSFERKFQLNGRVQVRQADYEEGIVRIAIVRLPEEVRPTSIKVNAKSPVGPPQLLNETFDPNPVFHRRYRT